MAKATNFKTMATVDKLYAWFEELNAAGVTISKAEETAYKGIVSGSSGDVAVKQLAAQFIPRFIGNFPKMEEKAINAQFDLCEDEDMNVRLHAYRGLSTICQSNPSNVTRIADVLGQLLLTEDSKELQIVKDNLTALFDIDLMGTLRALLAQVASKDSDESLRSASFVFLQERMPDLRKRINEDADLQLVLAKEISAIVDQGVDRESTEWLVGTLKRLPECRKNEDMKEILSKTIAKMSHVDDKFDAKDTNAIEELIHGMKLAPADMLGPFVDLFYSKIISNFSKLSIHHQSGLLRCLFRSTREVSNVEGAARLPAIYALFKSVWDNHSSTKTDDVKGELLGQVYVQEELLLLLHAYCNAAPTSIVKQTCGLFVPRGQPDEASPELQEAKSATLQMLTAVKERATTLKERNEQVIKALKSKVKEAEGDEKSALSTKMREALQLSRGFTSVVTLATQLSKNSPTFLASSASAPSWRPQPKQKKDAAKTGTKGAPGAAKESKGKRRVPLSLNSQPSKRTKNQSEPRRVVRVLSTKRRK